jgi:hypothetical protein
VLLYKSVATKPRERLLTGSVTTESRRKELFYQPIKFGLLHRFRLAYDLWLSDTQSLSRFDKIMAHESFTEIVSMGEPALPLIFSKLADQPSFIYLAAQRILGGTPRDLTPANDFDSLVASWLEWSERAGYRNSTHG